MEHKKYRKSIGLLTSGAAIALILAACGGSSHPVSTNPRTTVNRAVANFGAQSSFTARISFGPKVVSLAQSESSQPLSPLEKELLSSSISLGINTGGTAIDKAAASSSTHGSSEFALSIPGAADALEVRMVAQSIYLRLNLTSVLKITGKQIPAKTQSQISQIEAYYPQLKGVLSGHWVTVGAAELQKLEKSENLGQANTSQLSTLGRKEWTDISALLDDSSTKISRTSSSTYSLAVRDSAIQKIFSPLLATLQGTPSAQSLGKQPALGTKTGRGEIHLTMTIAGGKLKAIVFEIPSSGGDIPIELTFGAGSAIVAPSGATSLDGLINMLKKASGTSTQINPGGPMIPAPGSSA